MMLYATVTQRVRATAELQLQPWLSQISVSAVWAIKTSRSEVPKFCFPRAQVYPQQFIWLQLWQIGFPFHPHCLYCCGPGRGKESPAWLGCWAGFPKNRAAPGCCLSNIFMGNLSIRGRTEMLVLHKVNPQGVEAISCPGIWVHKLQAGTAE